MSGGQVIVEFLSLSKLSVWILEVSKAVQLLFTSMLENANGTPSDGSGVALGFGAVIGLEKTFRMISRSKIAALGCYAPSHFVASSLAFL